MHVVFNEKKKKKDEKKKQFIKIITWEALWSKQAHVNLEVHWTWYSMINVETRDYFILFNTSFSHHALNWQKKNSLLWDLFILPNV